MIAQAEHGSATPRESLASGCSLLAKSVARYQGWTPRKLYLARSNGTRTMHGSCLYLWIWPFPPIYPLFESDTRLWMQARSIRRPRLVRGSPHCFHQLTADPCTDRIVATGQVELEKYRGTALLETLLRSPPQFLRRAIAVKECRTVVVLTFRNVLVLRAQARTNILGKPRLVS
jgi:hypothetical protein